MEFKNKILNLCNVTDVKEIGGMLMNAVLKNDIDFFNGYNSIIDDTKDWLQALWQYYEADRTEKKQDYTPKSLCKLVSALANDCKTVYDCCGGSGALTIEVLKNHNIDNVYVEELDGRVIPFLIFNLCLHNTSGYVVNGDTLTGQIKKAYFLNKGDTYSTCSACEVVNVDDVKMDIAISNPPYNIKWEPPLPLEVGERFPVIPPSSNANYAFVLHCLSKTKKRAVLILPNSVCTSAQDLETRKYLIENDLIESIVTMPEKMFEATDISACIMILNKSKKYKGKAILVDSRKNCITETREQNGQFGDKSHTGRTYKKTYNVLSDDNINQILDAIENCKEIADFSKVVNNAEIAEYNYCFQPSIFFDIQLDKENHRSYEDIVNDLNYIIKTRNSCKLIINESLAKELNFDTETYKKAMENSKENTKNIKVILSLNLLSDDYISFTKNKNEICFKSNDKEVLSHLFKFFIMRWSQDIDLLNSMENRFLAELRDALIPDLLIGKVDASNINAKDM